MWETELAGMRDRIRAMRTGLVDAIKAQGVTQDFSFVAQQRGMFSYTGLTAAQVERMKDEFGIYAVFNRPYLPGRTEHQEPRLRCQGNRRRDQGLKLIPANNEGEAQASPF